MLNSGKKFALCVTKNHNSPLPPLCKLNGRSLTFIRYAQPPQHVCGITFIRYAQPPQHVSGITFIMYAQPE